jgi:hypothetical protein
LDLIGRKTHEIGKLNNGQVRTFYFSKIFLGKGKFVPVHNYFETLLHKEVWGNGGIAPQFLTLAQDGV